LQVVYPVDLFVIAFGIAVIVIWFVMFAIGLKNANLFDKLPAEDYPLKELYFVGFALLKCVKKEYKTAKDRRLRRQLSVIYQEKYAEFYLRAVYCKQISMSLLVLAFAAPMYCIAQGSMIAFTAVIAGAGVTFYYYGETTVSKISKRSEDMLIEFPNVASKLALLINSGMILREAWERVAKSGKGILYQEMRRSIILMRNGWSETDALFSFGQRCMVPEIKKFTSTLIQGAKKGNRELAMIMTRQSKEVWELKRQFVRRQGEMANNKLMIPIFLTFIGILIMVIVPIFSNLGV
jgi:Flp pilus assembly protein TadB